MASTIAVQALHAVNPDPSTAKAHHVGNPRTAFRNPWPSFQEHSRWELFQLRFGNNPEKNFVPVPEGPDGTRSTDLVKVLKPTWGVDQNDKLRATWIGHASFLVETPAISPAHRGIRILFDAVFSERTSPVNWAGPKRYTPPPCSVDELPEVDIVCISHNHYDHLDIHTIQPLYARRKGHVHFLVGLGTRDWFIHHIGCSSHEVTELDWWEAVSVSIPEVGGVDFTCCPTQHFSGRTIWDMGKALWCSWAVSMPTRKFYFTGDTAYQAQNTPSPCPVFAQIGNILGPFDLAVIPIGLYSPPKVGGSVHVTPEQALEIHKDIKSRLSIGMHYGTVRGGLSAVFEPVTDPPKRWRVAAEEQGIWCGGGVEGTGEAVDVEKGGVGLCHVGETVAV